MNPKATGFNEPSREGSCKARESKNEPPSVNPPAPSVNPSGGFSESPPGGSMNLLGLPIRQPSPSKVVRNIHWTVDTGDVKNPPKKRTPPTLHEPGPSLQ